jgi:NDP-sugar pyrophosphorylase family protein
MQRPTILAETNKIEKVWFEKRTDYLRGVLSENPAPLLSMSLLGKQLIIRNFEKLVSTYPGIKSVCLPSGMPNEAKAIADSFPLVQINEYTDEGSDSPSTSDILRVPFNSIVTESADGNCIIKEMLYPWDILEAMEYVLDSEVRVSNISTDSSISETAVIEGPCVVESGVQIDDFCKIKGPIYISADTKIGTGSLLRKSMIGEKCVIGFTCEIAKSYLAGSDTIPHLDVILDTVIGENTWMGAFIGTTNAMLNHKNVMYRLDDKLVDTGLQHFGAIIGHDCTIGAGTIILPGRYIPSGSYVPPNAVFSSIEKLEQISPRLGKS